MLTYLSRYDADYCGPRFMGTSHVRGLKRSRARYKVEMFNGPMPCFGQAGGLDQWMGRDGSERSVL